MQKIIFFTMYMYFSNSIYSQNLVVDKKAGFRDFKIDGSFNPFRAQCLFDGMSPQNDSVFKYYGTCCPTLYGKKITMIALVVSEGKIQKIELYLETIKYKEFPGYETYCEKNFLADLGKGDKRGLANNQNYEVRTYLWIGTKIRFQLSVYYGPTIDGDMYGVVQIYKNTPNDGF